MANADGSVIFSCDLDSTKAQKKLSKLRDEISELNSKLEKETGNKMNLEKQLDAASQAAKATEERVKMLRKEVERLNDREWIQKQGFTQSEYQAHVLRACAYRGRQLRPAHIPVSQRLHHHLPERRQPFLRASHRLPSFLLVLRLTSE